MKNDMSDYVPLPPQITWAEHHAAGGICRSPSKIGLIECPDDDYLESIGAELDTLPPHDDPTTALRLTVTGEWIVNTDGENEHVCCPGVDGSELYFRWHLRPVNKRAGFRLNLQDARILRAGLLVSPPAARSMFNKIHRRTRIGGR